MDKLTIEEKAKAYDFSLERAKRLYEQGTITESLSYVFPQLKKLGDGEVRKEIIQLIQCMHEEDPRKERWLAWLEKQNPIMAKSPQLGEQKPAWSEEDEYYREHLLGWISSLKNYIHYDALVSLEKRRERIDEVSKLENWLKSLKQRIGG